MLMKTMGGSRGAGRGSPLSTYQHQTEGTLGVTDYKMYFLQGGERISPWHDIPLFPPVGGRTAGLVVNMVNEIPRHTSQKMEVDKDARHNPIMHDLDKQGGVRLLKYSALPWNYGMVPQTWEDPCALFTDPADPSAQPLRGDGDPVDVVELGDRVLGRGEVLPVRLLGAFALLDEGELDWKLLAIALDDPRAGQLHTLADLLRHMPQHLNHVHEWYQNYKIAEGKSANKFAFRGSPQDEKLAATIIQETHQHWKKLHTK